jgi:hypothetical protein
MTMHFAKSGIVCCTVLASALAGLLTSTAAEAGRGAKEFYSQDYQFAQPMHGFQGQQGNYYCSYQRLPNRVCSYDANGNEKCQVKGWTLRQYCY